MSMRRLVAVTVTTALAPVGLLVGCHDSGNESTLPHLEFLDYQLHHLHHLQTTDLPLVLDLLHQHQLYLLLVQQLLLEHQDHQLHKFLV